MDKVSISTMSMMTKETHPFCIKPQLVNSSSQSLEDMNLDIDDETFSYFQPSDSFSSPTKPLMMDTIDWANSQPVALKSLLSEVKKIPEKRPINNEPIWPTSDGSLNQVASTSRTTLEAKSRPLRRTNSSARARLGPEPAPTSSNPPPAPDGAFWGKDRLTVLVACQNVSERMDESAFALAAQAYSSAPAKLPSKRKPMGPYLHGISKTKGASTSHSVIYEREGVNRWEKGKRRATLLSEAMPMGTNHQYSSSVPVVTRPLQRVSSSSSSAGASTDFSSPDTSIMDIDTDLQDETPPSSIPVPPSILPVKRPPQPGVPTRSTSISSTNASSPVPASAPQPQIQLHPLLTQKQMPKPNPSNTTKHPLFPQYAKPPLPSGPLLSQSTRPPPLGMRRAHTAPAATHALPTRQKAFKPPLLSQPSRSQAKANIAPMSVTEVNSKLHRPEPKPSPEPETNADADADSSFGDISLGMDDEELEMTMRQYD